MAKKNKPTSQPTNTGLVLLTEDAIRAGMYGGVGLKRQQAALLGIKSMQKGWLDRLVGVKITEAAYERFLELGKTGKHHAAKAKKGTWHVRDGALTFGKYKGSALGVVLRDDPSYLAWACENMEGFDENLTPAMRKTVLKASKGRSGTLFHSFRSKPATRPPEAKNDLYRPRIQPPAEEERYFTAREMTMDPTFDVDAANADDSIPFFQREDAPSNAFDNGGFPTKDRMDYHSSMLNPTHEAFRQLGSHLDSVFEKHHGGAMEPDDDEPPW